MNRSWKSTLAVLLVGLLIGTGIGWWSRDYCRQFQDKDPYARMLEKFSDEIDLSPDQIAAVGKILEAKREKITALRAEVHPRFKEIRESTRAEIRALLTDQQRPKFEKLQEEWDARFKKRRG